MYHRCPGRRPGQDRGRAHRHGQGHRHRHGQGHGPALVHTHQRAPFPLPGHPRPGGRSERLEGSPPPASGYPGEFHIPQSGPPRPAKEGLQRGSQRGSSSWRAPRSPRELRCAPQQGKIPRLRGPPARSARDDRGSEEVKKSGGEGAWATAPGNLPPHRLGGRLHHPSHFTGWVAGRASPFTLHGVGGRAGFTLHTSHRGRWVGREYPRPPLPSLFLHFCHNPPDRRRGRPGSRPHRDASPGGSGKDRSGT